MPNQRVLRGLSANPSAVVSAELGFARLAQEKGQWTAFRNTADRYAEMFVPQRISALSWLKGKADPVHAIKWQPHDVWMSCDGTAGVTHGAWQGIKGTTGYFTTVWLRQPDGSYKWLLDHGAATGKPIPAPEMISAKTATCSGRPNAPIIAPPEGTDMKQGFSHDQSMIWISSVAPDGARVVQIKLWNGTSHVSVLTETLSAKDAAG